MNNILKHIFSCSGRANRKEFLIFNIAIILILFCMIALISAIIIDTITSITNNDPNLSMMLVLIYLVLFIIYIVFCLASLFVTIRRLHDINKSGWWLLFIIFIPLLGGLFYFALFFIGGTIGSNEYGEEPDTKSDI